MDRQSRKMIKKQRKVWITRPRQTNRQMEKITYDRSEIWETKHLGYLKKEYLRNLEHSMTQRECDRESVWEL